MLDPHTSMDIDVISFVCVCVRVLTLFNYFMFFSIVCVLLPFDGE